MRNVYVSPWKLHVCHRLLFASTTISSMFSQYFKESIHVIHLLLYDVLKIQKLSVVIHSHHNPISPVAEFINYVINSVTSFTDLSAQSFTTSSLSTRFLNLTKL